MVERITSRRSTLRTLPALREEALPRPRAQRMCCGVHTESSADRSEMGKIDRSRRRRGCAGALRHKICTASLDNRPLIDGFVFLLDPALFVVSHNMSMINTTSNWLCFCSFLSSPVPSLRIHWPLTTGYCSRATGHYPLASRPTPHAALRWNQRGQVMRKPSPASISVTDRRIAKDRTGPDLDGPSYLIMSPNQAIPADKSNNSSSSRSLPTNR